VAASDLNYGVVIGTSLYWTGFLENDEIMPWFSHCDYGPALRKGAGRPPCLLETHAPTPMRLLQVSPEFSLSCLGGGLPFALIRLAAIIMILQNRDDHNINLQVKTLVL